jgi:hypothetical protein
MVVVAISMIVVVAAAPDFTGPATRQIPTGRSVLPETLEPPSTPSNPRNP